jgi:hypothetical protein
MPGNDLNDYLNMDLICGEVKGIFNAEDSPQRRISLSPFLWTFFNHFLVFLGLRPRAIEKPRGRFFHIDKMHSPTSFKSIFYSCLFILNDP